MEQLTTPIIMGSELIICFILVFIIVKLDLGGGLDQTAKSNDCSCCERHRAGQAARRNTEQYQKAISPGK